MNLTKSKPSEIICFESILQIYHNWSTLKGTIRIAYFVIILFVNSIEFPTLTKVVEPMCINEFCFLFSSVTFALCWCAKMAYNGPRVCVSGGLEALTFRLGTKLVRSNNFDISTLPAIAHTRCYRLAFFRNSLTHPMLHKRLAYFLKLVFHWQLCFYLYNIVFHYV